MTKSPSYNYPDYDRPFIDYHTHRAVAGQLRAKAINSSLSRGLVVVTPSRRTLRTLGFAFLVATGAFWGVMLNDPPKTVAADPALVNKGLSPLDFKVPVELSGGEYIAN